jgi:hypothetical protein
MNVDQIETAPEAVRYFEFRDPFGKRLSFYELLRNHVQQGAPTANNASALLRRARG